ncbi:DUF3883 domain-containing protein [Enterococcus sp. AZ072]|uniref:DUF3883 domain-containing protein n=1 Tax=unclassified Enterococcus TaxID=2608891 RepID=UPI003D289AFA
MQLFFQACSLKDKKSDNYKNYQKSIVNGIPLEQFREWLSIGETEISYEELEALYPEGTVYLWGLIEGSKKQWGKLDNDTTVLFYLGDNKIGSTCNVLKTATNDEIAKEVWGFKEGTNQLFRHLYFVDKPKDVDISSYELLKDLGYTSGNEHLQSSIILKSVEKHTKVYNKIINGKYKGSLELRSPKKSISAKEGNQKNSNSKFYIFHQELKYGFDENEEILWFPQMNKESMDVLSSIKNRDILLLSYSNSIYAAVKANSSVHKDESEEKYSVKVEGLLLGKQVDLNEYLEFFEKSYFKYLNSVFMNPNEQNQLHLLNQYHAAFIMNEVQAKSKNAKKKEKLFSWKKQEVFESLAETISDDEVGWKNIADNKFQLDKFSGKESSELLGELSVSKTKRSNLIKNVDYDKNNRIKGVTGKVGEQLAYEILKQKYSGKEYIVRHVSSNSMIKEDMLGDGLGYDIVVINQKTKKEICFEVKSTTRSNGPFDITAREVEKMNEVIESDDKEYKIFRIFNLNKEKFSFDWCVFDINEDFENEFEMIPTSFKFGKKQGLQK